jgi:nucleoside-diphosphate-sugar epimerase
VKVLVTGATGFTGGHLARALKRRGHDVRAMVRPSTRSARSPLDFARGDPEPVEGSGQAPDLERDGITLVAGDLADPASLPAAVDHGFDVIYNIAALYRQAGLPESVYHQVNATAVGQLIDAAAHAGVRRVVHCSTVGVHGDVEHPPAGEDAPLAPGDVYQVSKVEGERIAREAAARTGVEVVIARPSGIYGPGDRRLLKLFRGVARRRFVILGDGKIFYHLTYIDDLVEGFRLCGEVPRAAGRTYILAGGEIPLLNDLAALIAEEARVPPPSLHLPVWPFWLAGAACEAVCAPFGIEPPLYRRRVDFFTKSRAFDISRAREELGYAPAVDLREGIRKTLSWYREQGWI